MRIKLFVFCLGLIAAFSRPGTAAELSSGLKALQGKWAVARTNQEGRVYQHTMLIENDKLTFERRNQEGVLRFIAKGLVRVENAGPIQTFTVSDIQAGRSADDLSAADETRSYVFAIRENKLVLAVGFDRERENEQPGVEAYERLSAGAAANGASGEGEIWNLEVSREGQTVDYKVRIDRIEPMIEATLISPRSGEHKFKSIVHKDDTIQMEIDREYAGQNVTIIFKGKRTDAGFAGTMTAKDLEEQVSGKWKAWK